MRDYITSIGYALHNESGQTKIPDTAHFNLFIFRRYFDMTGSCLGLIFCSSHLALLCYLVIKKNGKSYELLISQAILSVLTLLLLISGCILDILDDVLPYPLLFFRAYIWLFLVNSLMGAYGNLVVVLCLDRYVAMHRPLYYRNHFAKKRMRYSLIGGSVVVGFLTCMHWLVVNYIDEPTGDILENVEITDDFLYNFSRAISYILKYLVPGVSMSTITWANIMFLRKSVRSYDDDLRIARQDKIDQVVSIHTNISRISIFLAITFIVCNWPYAVFDYFYDESLEAYTVYAVAVLIINFLQIVYIQLNLLFFSLCSSVYRRALMHVLKKPGKLCHRLLERLRSLLAWRSKSGRIYQDERYLSMSTDSSLSAKTVFTVC